ncbi:MAG TPA: conjugative transposon protein TraJ [Petrimonas sp.]|nr:conjugative transposon protein TraJ [Petrimonas sp.]
MDFQNLHQILRELYTDMMPLASNMAGIARGIAGLGALFYIAYRVWVSLANAQPIDVFPLLRPFALGICILFFPSIVLGTINGVLSPVVKGTHQMVETQTLDMKQLKTQRDLLEKEAMLRDPETAYLVSNEEFDKKIEELSGLNPRHLKTMAGMYYERTVYQLKKAISDAFRTLLEIIFQAAGLIIDTIRTFFLIVLSILGPIVFALAVWDGLQSSLVTWLSRYISVYLWLPVSDLFSAMMMRIQGLMMKKDIEALKDPSFVPDLNNTVYIIFLLIGIVGFFVVPTVSGWIVEAGGGIGNYGKNINEQSQKAGGAAASGGKAAAAAGGAAAGNVAGRIRGMLRKK